MEILVCLFLLVLVGTFAISRQGSERGRASALGLADAVAAELRAARSRALSQGSPVALCFPSDGGTRPHSQSFSLLEGQARGRVVRVRDYSSTFGEGYIAIGNWGNATLQRPNLGGPDFHVENWLPTNKARDFCLVFNSDGSAWSNDLPLLNGSYVITICSGVRFGPGAALGTPITSNPPPQFRFSEVSAPSFLLVRPTGGLTVQQGALGALPVAAHTVPTDAAAAPPSLVPPPVGVPVVDLVETIPAPLAGKPTQVAVGESLTIAVKATDSEGGDLSVEWEAVRLSGAGSGVGTFSSRSKVPMIWDSQENRWELRTTWLPPADGVPGDTFDIKITVSNSGGASTAAASALLTGIELVPNSKLLLTTAGFPGLHWELNLHGIGLKQVFSSGVFTTGNKPRLSPNGTKLAWFEGMAFPNQTINVANSDGGNAKVVATIPMGGASCGPVAWNHLGTRIYLGNSDPDKSIASVRADGTGTITQYNRALGGVTALDVSDDGRFLACIASTGFDGTLNIARINPATGALTGWRDLTLGEPSWMYNQTTTRPNAFGNDLSFAPNPPAGKQILVYGTAKQGGMLGNTHHQYVAEIDEATLAASLQPLKDNFGNDIVAHSPSFSPFGDRLAVTEGDFSFDGVWVWNWDPLTSPPTVASGVRIDAETDLFMWVVWR